MQPTPAQIKAGWDQIEDLFGRNNIAGLLDYVKSNPYYLNAKNPEWDNNTILQMFVVDEQEDNVEKYLKLKPDLKQSVYTAGGTLLMQVVEGELDPNIAKMLIDADPETVNIANEAGQVPLMFAVQGENEYIVYDLVKNGAKKDAKDSSGNDVWSYFNGDADSRKAVEDAMNGINPGGDETGTLVADDEPLTAEELTAQKDLFKWIILGDRLQLVKDILTRHPKLTNLKYDDETPLEAAVSDHDFEMVKWMVEHGAIVTETAVEFAQEMVQEEDADEEERAIANDILRYVSEARAPGGQAAAAEEPLSARELEEQRELFDEIDGGSLREVRVILTQYPRLLDREFDADDDGLMESPLRRAVNTQNIHLIRLILELGATVTPQILQYQREIVDDARPGGDRVPTAILRLLDGVEEEEEEEEEPLTIEVKAARKKLHEAIESKDNVTAKAVLAQHPKLANIRYNDETPLTNAVSSRNLEFVNHLIDNGVYLDEDDLDHANYLASNIATRDLSAEEQQIARDILAVIQARLDVVEAARPVVPRLDIPPRALDFGDESALPTLEVTEIEYKELPDVFDMTLNKDIPIFDALAKRRIIFTVDDSYYGITLGSIESSLKDKTSTFYECKKELKGSPYTNDVHIDTPYFRLTLNGNFTVTEKDLQSALASECSIFELVPNEKKLAFVSSYASVQVSPGRNGLGQTVNIVSSDHCQKGSDQFTYDVKAVTMVKYRSAEQKEVDRVQAEKKAVEDAAVAERMKQEAIVRKKAQEEQAARVAARGSGRRRTYRKSAKGKKSTKRKTYRK